MTGPYDDMINLPHPVSAKRPQMPLSDRAAQFSPFDALTGYEDAIRETARLTEERTELDEYERAALDRKQQLLREAAARHPQVTVCCFKADERKAGGKYISVSGRLKKLDERERVLVLEDGRRIAFEDIVDLDCDLGLRDETEL